MKKLLIIAMLLIPMMGSAQKIENRKPDQVRVGLGGYPLMETLFNVGFGHYPDIIWRGPELGMIYQDYKTPTYSTGVITAEASWFVRKWFTFSLTGATSLTWQGYRDSVTDKRTGTDVGVNLYIVPQARFNWVRGERVRMYSTIGLGGVIGITGDEFLALPAIQLTPIGIEIGKKLYWFGEAGMGMLYFGGQTGIGYRF